MRFCPQCHLILEQAECDVAAWACRSCGGVWLSAADFAEAIARGPVVFREMNATYPGVANAGMFEGLSKPCPDCRTTALERTPLSGTAQTTPFTCAACDGVWLGPKERTALAVDSEIAVAAPPDESNSSTEAQDRTDSPISPSDLSATSIFTTPSEAAIPNPVEAGAEPVSAVEPFKQPPGPMPAFDEPTKQNEPISVQTDRAAEPPSVAVAEPPTEQELPAPPWARAAAPLTRWCPQCRRGYSDSESFCRFCNIGLASSNFPVLCLVCRRKNPIAQERCWNCRYSLHPEGLSGMADATHGQPNAALDSSPPVLSRPSSGSCATTALVLFVLTILSGILALAFRP